MSGAASISAEISQQFEALRANRMVLRQSSAKERIAKLRSIKAYLLDSKHEKELEQAMWKDLRKSATEVLSTEVGPLLMSINHICKFLSGWMAPKGVDTPISMAGLSSHIRYQAKGVCLIFSPWNYPFQLTINPLLYAIAAGNAVVLKPSEISAHTTAFITKMMGSLFPKNEVTVIEGDAKIAAVLMEFPFNHVFFTGSPQVGKIVMRAAANHLTSVTLELGGKSPAIIDDSVNLKKVAEQTAWAKLLNNGQTCIAPDYILIQQSIASKFITFYEEAVQKLYNPNDLGIDQSEDYGRIINDANFDRLSGLIEDAKNKGAQLIFSDTSKPEERFMSPVLLTGVTSEMKVMQEEIFGPILPIISFDRISDIPEILEQQLTPLSFYIQSKNRKTVDYILENSASGGAVINDYMVGTINPNLPFGGLNNSGIGKSNGLHSFIEFSNERGIVRRGWGTLKFLYPPFAPWLKKVLKFLFKHS